MSLRKSIASSLRACANRLDPEPKRREANLPYRSEPPTQLAESTSIVTESAIPSNSGRWLGKWIPGDTGDPLDRDSSVYVGGSGGIYL